MIEFDSVSKQYEINHRRAKSLRDVFSFNKSQMQIQKYLKRLMMSALVLIAVNQ